MKSKFYVSILAILAAGTSFTPTYSASDRAKKAAGVLVGGGVGGTIAGVAGSGKWVPLGLVGGAIFGGILAAKLIKRHRRKKAERHDGSRYTYYPQPTSTSIDDPTMIDEPYPAAYQNGGGYYSGSHSGYVNQYGKKRYGIYR